MRPPRLSVSIAILAAAWLSLLAADVLSQAPEIPKISVFAPSKDLLQQVDFFLGRVSESLADEKDFDLAKQARTLKDGNTLAVLALMLAMHDEDHPLKRTSGAMLKAAQQLIAAEDNVERATAALAALKSARAGDDNAQAAPVRWEQVAQLAPLMKQVPLIHSGLKRGVEPNRLSRQAAQSAGQAAALAAIAQESMLDVAHLKTGADVDKWRACCVQMRDAAGEVNSAVRAADQGRVDAGMRKLAQSCETCHASFRHE